MEETGPTKGDGTVTISDSHYTGFNPLKMEETGPTTQRRGVVNVGPNEFQSS